MCRLPWLPDDYERRMLFAMNGPSLDEDGYAERVNMLREISNEIVTKLQQEGIYGEDPASEAFIRTHDEPGRAWNMQEWNQKRKRPSTLSLRSSSQCSNPSNAKSRENAAC
jgi:hypothetical protein